MAEDWDLYAVVRSCTSAANTTRAVENNNNDLPSNGNCSSSFEDPLACLASLTFEEDDDPFPFPNLSQLTETGHLQDSYKPFLPNADRTTAAAIDPCSSSSHHGGSSRQLHQHQQKQPAAAGIGSPLTPTSAPLFTFAGFGNQQQVQPQSHQQQQTRAQPPVQTPRSRKR